MFRSGVPPRICCYANAPEDVQNSNVKQKRTVGFLHHCMSYSSEHREKRNRLYLFIILQFVVQDDAIGLVRLGPGEGDAVHTAAHLVHYRHCGWSCKKT